MKFDFSFWKKTLSEKEKKQEERNSTLQKTIYVLKAYFGDKNVKKVYLVGSILQPHRFFPFSDIDIAVEGLEEPYLQTLVAIEDLLGRDVDLIELEKSSLKESLEEIGVRIV